MSINFNDPLNKKRMTALAKAARQPATVELHDEDEIKEMSDGTKYKVTPRGWVKVMPAKRKTGKR